MAIRIASMYWSNIAPGIIQAQADVFRHFGYAIDQQEATGTAHDAWLYAYMSSLGEDDIAVFVDIDCIPTQRDAVEKAVAAAAAGRLYGCAQSANHTTDPDFVYAGPMFMALGKDTWTRIGKPSFGIDASNDVAARVTRQALAAGVQVELIWPRMVCLPRWRLSTEGVFGIGTFYDTGVFHLFESRASAFGKLFSDVATQVLADQPCDYLALARKASVLDAARKPLKHRLQAAFFPDRID